MLKTVELNKLKAASSSLYQWLVASLSTSFI